MISKGTWVQIHRIILSPEERAPQVPEDTKQVPLEMWVKGYLLEDSNMGDVVRVQTLTDRIEEGELVHVHPSYKHNYGSFVPELLAITQMVRELTFGKEE